jgi:5'-3' exonuclease
MDDPNKPLILVDSSYFSIKRATALVSWWQRAFPDDPKSQNLLPWVLNSVYLQKYTELYKKNIDNLAKHFGVSPQNILFARDCPRDTIWRKKLFPGYKASRDPDTCIAPGVPDEIVETMTIGLNLDVSAMSPGWASLKDQIISPETLGVGPVIKHNNETFLKSGYVRLMRIDFAEADDICAVIAMRVRKFQPTRRIIIVANDQDYMQLVDPFLTVVEIPKFNDIKKGDLTSEQALLFKIIGGDSSDDIPSCGYHGAKQLACDPAKLKETLESNAAFKAQFDLNSKLVDFRNIPSDIQENIWQDFLRVAPEFMEIAMSPIPSSGATGVSTATTTATTTTATTTTDVKKLPKIVPKIVPKITLKKTN